MDDRNSVTMRPVNSARLHERLLDRITQPVVASDLEGRITYWNRLAQALYGRPADDVIGRPFADVIPRGSGMYEWPLLDEDGKRAGTIHFSPANLAREAARQSALARVGQLALSSASLGFMFAQTAETVRDILGTDACAIFKSNGESFLLVGGDGFPPGAAGSGQDDATRKSQAGYTLEIRQPVITSDLRNETRFTPSALLLAEGVRSALTVVIEVSDEKPWGVLGAYSRSQTEFLPADVDFLSTLASILGQAIDHRQREVELRVRALQQSAIAELGHYVITADVDQRTLERACELVMSGLGVEFSQYLQSDDDGESLFFRAGQAWLTPPARIPMDASQAGYAMRTGRAVVIADYNREDRFETSQLFTSHGIRSGIAVPVIGRTRKFGVLTAQTRSLKAFDAADVHFMESLAAVFADALTREVGKHELVESEARYRSVVDGASEIIFSLTATGVIIALNPAFEAITGWRCEEWIGRGFDGLVEPEYLPAMQELFASILREPRPVRTEAHLRGKERGEILVSAAVSPKIENGEVVEIYGFARDVTDERRLEAERNRVTRDLQLILDSTDEGIYATDVDGRCTLVNRSAAKLLSASPDWLIGSDIHSLIHPKSPGASPDQVSSCAVIDVLRSGKSHSSRDDIFCSADGTPFPVEFTVSPIIDGGAIKGSVVAFNDISVRRKLESKLEQANRLTSLGRLAATVAHEFNNVLMGISPFAEVLRREHLGERAQAAVDQIARSVKRGKRITEDILRFTQPSEPVLVPFDGSAWLHAMALEARSLIGPKYSIDVDAPDEPLSVTGDVGQLHQSFINLILNARDAMSGGGRIRISLRRLADERGYEFAAVDHPARYAHFTVEDTGPGMSPETLRHIFEPLFTMKKNGTGLGLSVARHVVTRHGGEIFVESTAGVGTKFHLLIPLAERPGAVKAVPGPDERPHPRRYSRVLLVEDERPVAAGLAALLELEGIESKIVELGRDVLSAIAEWGPHAIVLDIGLPDIDGTKVFESVARAYPRMPVVFSSGHGDESQLEQQTARPHVEFLLKPYDIDTLLATLDRVVT